MKMNILNLAKKFLIGSVVGIFFVGCAADQHVKHFTNLKNYPKSKKIMARITFYTNHEDKWGSRVAMSKYLRACEGVTVAAPPVFNFGLPIEIPALKGILNNTGKFEIQDRGGDVTREKASRGKCFVFDVYLFAKSRRDGRRKINHFSSLIHPYEEVKILN